MRLSALGTLVVTLILAFVAARIAAREGWSLGDISTVEAMFGIAIGFIVLLAAGGGSGGTPTPARSDAPAGRFSRIWR